MDQNIEQTVRSLFPAELEVLEISGDKWATKCTFKGCQSVSFPQFDICRDRLESKFDLIIAEQVFEHLLEPAAALKNMRAMLRPGGRVIISTPFLLKIHNHPIDCYRWSALGLRQFLRSGGFADGDISVKAWGNRACVRANLDRWVRYSPIFHSLKNEGDFPVVVWAIAKID